MRLSESTHHQSIMLAAGGMASRVRVVSGSGGVAGAGGSGVGPGLALFVLLVVLALLALALEGLHGVGDGGVLRLGLTLGLFVLTGILSHLLLGVGVSEHEEIDDHVPRLVAGDETLDLEGLASEEPEHVGDGEAGLVVGRDGNINPVQGGVRVAKGNDGDVHVGGLSEGLVVEAGVANDHESGLEELLRVLVSKRTWDPFSTEVVGAGVGGELENGSLGVLARGHDEDIFFVLSLDGSDDSGGNHGLLPRFGQVEVEDAISSAIVYVRFHLRVAVLGSDVHLSGDHVDDVLVSVIRVQKRHSV
mmetsp:Transcript_46989/g.62195  ORF Transcript_46989/g.62195 Transcript_46989/m.62195 type:complete len:304 (+) Transcript_46989:170-1081(+)